MACPCFNHRLFGTAGVKFSVGRVRPATRKNAFVMSACDRRRQVPGIISRGMRLLGTEKKRNTISYIDWGEKRTVCLTGRLRLRLSKKIVTYHLHFVNCLCRSLFSTNPPTDVRPLPQPSRSKPKPPGLCSPFYSSSKPPEIPPPLADVPPLPVNNKSSIPCSLLQQQATR